MKNKILVVGGYGQVGKHVCKYLAEQFPDKVIVGGRNIARAEKLIQSIEGGLLTRKVDIYDSSTFKDIMEDVLVVVMCLSPANTDFAEYCIKNGIHYIDISPTSNNISALEELSEVARQSNSTCVLGVGLLPGLSNLMVKEAGQELNKINSVKIFLMLGVGEKHGADGVKWLLDNINNIYTIKQNGKLVQKKSFGEKAQTTFPHRLKKKAAYTFDLADQHSIPKTLNVDSVTSYLTYDSRFITSEVVVLKRLGVFKLLRFRWGYSFFLKVFSGLLNIIIKLKLSSDIYSIKIDIEGEKDQNVVTYESSILGYNNSILTGTVAAIVAEELYMDNSNSGVYYFEQLFRWEQVYAKLQSMIEYKSQLQNKQLRS